MFGKRGMRRGRPPWSDEEHWEQPVEPGHGPQPDRIFFRGRHGWHHGERPLFEHDEVFWFMPRRHGPFSPPPGPGGPFSDDPFGEDRGGRRRQRRGDIKYVLLELLAQQPRHGYELIKELENHYGGFYRPSPGTVYPTLQLLEDEGHLTSETVDGKRVYTVTESGRQLLASRQSGPAEHRHPGPGMGARHPELNELRERMMALSASVMQLARHGTPEQVRAAIARLDATRREIYGLLAAEAPEQSAETE